MCPSTVMSVFMLFVSLYFSVSQYSNVSIYVIRISVFQRVPCTVMSVFMLFVSLYFSVSQYSNVSIYVIRISVFQRVPVQ